MTDRLITPEKRTYQTTYSLVFSMVDEPGAGFSFPCDGIGRVDIEGLPKPALDNYLSCCLDGAVNGRLVHLDGIRAEELVNVSNAVIRCDCGNLVELVDWYASECPSCGRAYNGGGQLLDRW